jgi:hypothetical protein
MQKGGDGFILVAAVGENRGSHAQEVGNVRPGGSLAELLCVQAGRIRQRNLKTLAQRPGFPRIRAG